MELFDTATNLRMNSRHIQQIAADVDKGRSAVVESRNSSMTDLPRPGSIGRLRQSVGLLLLRAGERLYGAPTVPVAIEQP